MALEESVVSEVTAAVEKVAEEIKNPGIREEGGADEHSEHIESESPDAGGTEGGSGTGDSGGEDSEKSGGTDGSAGDSSGDVSGDEEPVTKVGISEEAMIRAIRAGLTFEDVRAFTSEEALNRVSASIEKAAHKSAPLPDNETKEVDILDSIPKLDPDVYEPEVVKMFDALVGVVKKQQEAIKKFESNQEHVVIASQEATAKEVVDWFDKKVGELGEEFSNALGSGGYSSLKQGSPELAKRDEIANHVAVLLAGYRAAGQRAPSRDVLFDTAVRAVLKDEFLTAHEKKIAKELAKQKGQHVSRVGGQKTKPLSPLDETVNLINQRFFSGGE